MEVLYDTFMTPVPAVLSYHGCCGAQDWALSKQCFENLCQHGRISYQEDTFVWIQTSVSVVPALLVKNLLVKNKMSICHAKGTELLGAVNQSQIWKKDCRVCPWRCSTHCCRMQCLQVKCHHLAQSCLKKTFVPVSALWPVFGFDREIPVMSMTDGYAEQRYKKNLRHSAKRNKPLIKLSDWPLPSLGSFLLTFLFHFPSKFCWFGFIWVAPSCLCLLVCSFVLLL